MEECPRCNSHDVVQVVPDEKTRFVCRNCGLMKTID